MPPAFDWDDAFGAGDRSSTAEDERTAQSGDLSHLATLAHVDRVVDAMNAIVPPKRGADESRRIGPEHVAGGGVAPGELLGTESGPGLESSRIGGIPRVPERTGAWT